MKRIFLVLFVCVMVSFVKAQTSSNNGSFTTGSNWSGGSAPGAGWTTINIGHTMTRSGAYTVNGTMNINVGGALTLTGNVTVSGGSTINVYGTLYITGDVILNSTFTVFPGGNVIIDGNVSVVSSTNLVVGTTAAGPPYANLVITKNLTSTTSGDVTIKRNGRMAVFGNVNDGGSGGTVLQIDNGGQTYIHGNLNFTRVAGNNNVNNDNTTTPYGLYINGSTNVASGNTVDSNTANQATLQSTNNTFYSWITSQPGYPTPMPVKLISFKIDEISKEGVDLKWVTSMEKNFDYFLLERAGPDLNFKAISTISSKGGLDVTTAYEYLDSTPLAGKNYYRLKSVDYDLTSEYFDVVYANWDFENYKPEVSVYPNPIINNTFTLEVNHEITSNTNITLLNSMGTEVFQQYIQNSAEVIELRDDLKPGAYYLRITGSDFNKTIKVFIQ